MSGIATRNNLIDNSGQFIPSGMENLYGPTVLEQADTYAKNLQQYGPWQPWMQSVDDFMQPGPWSRDLVQHDLSQFQSLMGTPEDQAAKQAYFTMMGGTSAGRNYGGIISQPVGRFNQEVYNRMQPPDPWNALNSMGISPNYQMPQWQDQYFMANSGPGTGTESYNSWANGGGTTMPGYGAQSNWQFGSTPDQTFAPGMSATSPWSSSSNITQKGPWG